MADTYRPPVVASIFHGLGWLSLLGSIVVLSVSLRIAQNKQSDAGRSEFAGTSATNTYLLLFVPTGSAFFVTLMLFGTSQVLDHTGRIAFYARKSFERLEQADSLADSRWRHLQKTVENVRTNIVQMGAKRPPPFTTEAAGSVSEIPILPSMKFFYVDPDSQITGPVDVHQLRFLARTKAINDDTMICIEGEEDWKPLAENVSF